MCVPIPQLVSILKTGRTHVALWTYIFLFITLTCYLIHAIYIKSEVFATAQAVNLITNGTILILLVRYRNNAKIWK